MSALVSADAWHADSTRAFSVAAEASPEILETFRNLFVRAIAEGWSLPRLRAEAETQIAPSSDDRDREVSR